MSKGPAWQCPEHRPHCPTNDALSDFLVGKLPAREAAAVETVFADCTECGRRAERMSHSGDDVLVDLRNAPAIEEASPPEKRRRARRAVTVGVFLERLERSGLLDDDVMRSVRASAGDPDADGEPFVKQLCKAMTLTPYQAKVLWVDKGHKLTLGEYVILDELGRGGMGVVLKARHRRMKRQVAIKVLPPTLMRDADAIARFKREVEAASRLTHPNIVASHDAGEIDGQHYLVMEFVDGRDLGTIVGGLGVLPVDLAVDCVVQVARGLEFAHRRSVVHRDVKPGNVLLDANGVVKILDMGLARLVEAEQLGTQADLTGTGVVMGTVDYMSPEQALSTKSADARSDVYSLGMTLFRLLVGRPAYQGETLMARLLAHRTEPIPRIPDFNRDVPGELQSVFERMVAKEPDERYASMSDVVADLEAFRNGESPSTALDVSAPSAGGTEEDLDEFLVGVEDLIEDDGSEFDTASGRSHPTRTMPPSVRKRPPRVRKRPSRRDKEATPSSTNTADRRRLKIVSASVGAAALLGLLVLVATRPSGSDSRADGDGNGNVADAAPPNDPATDERDDSPRSAGSRDPAIVRVEPPNSDAPVEIPSFTVGPPPVGEDDVPVVEGAVEVPRWASCDSRTRSPGRR